MGRDRATEPAAPSGTDRGPWTYDRPVPIGEGDRETVERTIPAPAERIFDLLADPDRHHDIDGSGTVRGTRGSSARLELGSRFGMSMRLGVPYAMESTVIEFEEGRRLAWQTRGPGPVGRRFGGRIWRYELEPVDGGTLVRETWDLSEESAVTKPVARLAWGSTRTNMAATLERIEEILAAETGGREGGDPDAVADAADRESESSAAPEDDASGA
jgi:uncharacterized protein YndB with AHSA1/START domain